MGSRCAWLLGGVDPSQTHLSNRSAEGTPCAAPQGLQRERPAQTLLQLLWVPTTRALKSEPPLCVASHELKASLLVRMGRWLTSLEYERRWASSVHERTGGLGGWLCEGRLPGEVCEVSLVHLCSLSNLLPGSLPWGCGSGKQRDSYRFQ